METKCCLVFDVGKTNQKYFVFNTENKILKREKVTIPKVLDEDGHMAENIEGIVTWLRESFDLIMASNEFKIDKVNFSGFGATLVHLDEKKEVVTPSDLTSSVLYGFSPKSFSNSSSDFFRSLTAIPICSIFLITIQI